MPSLEAKSAPHPPTSSPRLSTVKQAHTGLISTPGPDDRPSSPLAPTRWLLLSWDGRKPHYLTFPQGLSFWSHERQPMAWELKERRFPKPCQRHNSVHAAGKCVRAKRISGMGDGMRPGKNKSTVPVSSQSKGGKSRTMWSVWVCGTVLRNVCRSKPIVTEYE